MKKVKFIALILLLSVIIGVFTGCLFTDEPPKNKSNIENEYQAKLYYSNSNFGVLDSFLNENRIYAGYQENDEYYLEENAPKSRTYIIEDLKTYREIFESKGALPDDLDFDEDILYLHIFRTWHSRDHYLDEISIIDDTLHIYIKDINTSIPNLLSIKQSHYGVADYFVVKMKRTGVSNVEFHLECDICDNEGKID